MYAKQIKQHKLQKRMLRQNGINRERERERDMTNKMK